MTALLALPGSPTYTRAQDRPWRDPEVPFEESGEMRLIGEARAQRDVREARIRLIEESACTIQPEREDVLVWWTPDGLPERTHEMRWAE